MYLYEEGDVNPPTVKKVWVKNEVDPTPRWATLWNKVLSWRW